MSLRQRSYEFAVTQEIHEQLRVSFPDPCTGLGRPRPRTVIVDRTVSPRFLLETLKQHNLIPQQIQGLLNSEIVVTFKIVADRQSFLNLDFVTTSNLASQNSSCPLWVRVHFKLAELQSKVIHDYLSTYGSILFSRENKIIRTDVLSGSLTMKMRLNDHIPSFIYIGPICLVVNYDGQPPRAGNVTALPTLPEPVKLRDALNAEKLAI